MTQRATHSFSHSPGSRKFDSARSEVYREKRSHPLPVPGISRPSWNCRRLMVISSLSTVSPPWISHKGMSLDLGATYITQDNFIFEILILITPARTPHSPKEGHIHRFLDMDIPFLRDDLISFSVAIPKQDRLIYKEQRFIQLIVLSSEKFKIRWLNVLRALLLDHDMVGRVTCETEFRSPSFSPYITLGFQPYGLA